MSPEQPQTPREELELKITALLLGELDADEAERVRQAIAADPELSRLHDQLKETIDLVDAAAKSQGEPAAPSHASAHLRLSEDKRSALLAHFKRPVSRAFSGRTGTFTGIRWLELAAVLLIVCVLAALLLPSLAKSKAKAQRPPRVTVAHGEPELGGSRVVMRSASVRENGGAREVDGFPASEGVSTDVADLPRFEPATLPPPTDPDVDGRDALGLYELLDGGQDRNLPTRQLAEHVAEGQGGLIALPEQNGINLSWGDPKKGTTLRNFPTGAGDKESDPDAEAGRRWDEGVARFGLGEMGTDWAMKGLPKQAIAGEPSALEPQTGLPVEGQPVRRARGMQATPDVELLHSSLPTADGEPSGAARPSAGYAYYGGVGASGPVDRLGSILVQDGSMTVKTDSADESRGGYGHWNRAVGDQPVPEERQGGRPLATSVSRGEPAAEITEQVAQLGQEIRLAEQAERYDFFFEGEGRVSQGLVAESESSTVGAGELLQRERPVSAPDAPGRTAGAKWEAGAMTVEALERQTEELAMGRSPAMPRLEDEVRDAVTDLALESEADASLGKPSTPAPTPIAAAEAELGDDTARSPAPVPQPEVRTEENPFSTFSLNVSDVSFQLAAASLEQGQMPAAAAVRSEEFLNAFDYHDPVPGPGQPLAFAWERARYPFAHNRDALRLSVQTAARGRETGRPLNLVLLLDNSGSMERADRTRIIRECLNVLAGQLTAQDRISVVTFARTARLRLDGVSGVQAPASLAALAQLTPEGGTNLEEAMRLAYATARRHYLADGINRVVLLTDGAANLGNVEPASLKREVETQRLQGVALDCFGIGWEGYNDDLLEVLSRNGDGRYGFVNSAAEAAPEFADALAGALHVAAADVKVQVEFNPDRVTAYRQIGYARHQLTKEQFRDNTVDAAEIGAAESGNALYLIETDSLGRGPIATVRARFKEPASGRYREQEWTVPYTGQSAPLEASSAAMRLAVGASAFSEWLAGSPYAGDVTPDRLLGVLDGVPEVFGANSRPMKLEWMIRQAGRIAGN